MDAMHDHPVAAASGRGSGETLQGRFQRLLERHRGIVLKVAHAYCRHPEDRRDLIQEISTQLWRAFPGYDTGRPFATWMYRVALNVAISQVRIAAGRSRHHVALDDAAWAQVPAADTDGEHERRQLLNQALERLDPMHRALLLLYLEERSQREIAEVLGISESNVATRLHRLRQRLREMFDDASH